MAVLIVDGLEVVGIDQQHTQGRAIALHAPPLAGQVLVVSPPVVQAGERIGVRQLRQALVEHAHLVHLLGQQPVGIGQPGQGLAQGDLTQSGVRQLGQHLHIARRPVPGLHVHRAKTAQHQPLRGHQRHPGIGPHAQGLRRGHVGKAGQRADIVQQQRHRREQGVMAEGAPLELTFAGQGLAKTDGALVEVPLGVHQGDKGGRHLQQAGGQASEAVEALFGRGVQQAGVAHRLQPRRVEAGGVHFVIRRRGSGKTHGVREAGKADSVPQDGPPPSRFALTTVEVTGRLIALKQAICPK